MVVSPDEGGAKRSVMIANSLGLEFAMIHNRHKKTVATAVPTPVITRSDRKMGPMINQTKPGRAL